MLLLLFVSQSSLSFTFFSFCDLLDFEDFEDLELIVDFVSQSSPLSFFFFSFLSSTSLPAKPRIINADAFFNESLIFSFSVFGISFSFFAASSASLAASFLAARSSFCFFRSSRSAWVENDLMKKRNQILDNNYTGAQWSMIPICRLTERDWGPELWKGGAATIGRAGRRNCHDPLRGGRDGDDGGRDDVPVGNGEDNVLRNYPQSCPKSSGRNTAMTIHRTHPRNRKKPAYGTVHRNILRARCSGVASAGPPQNVSEDTKSDTPQDQQPPDKPHSSPGLKNLTHNKGGEVLWEELSKSSVERIVSRRTYCDELSMMSNFGKFEICNATKHHLLVQQFYSGSIGVLADVLVVQSGEESGSFGYRVFCLLILYRLFPTYNWGLFLLKNPGLRKRTDLLVAETHRPPGCGNAPTSWLRKRTGLSRGAPSQIAGEWNFSWGSL